MALGVHGAWLVYGCSFLLGNGWHCIRDRAPSFIGRFGISVFHLPLADHTITWHLLLLSSALVVLRDWAFVALGGVGSGVSNIQTNKPPADCAFRVVEEREVMEVACSIACLLSAIQTSKLFIQTNRHCFQCR